MFFFLFDEDKPGTGSYTSPFDSIKQLDDEGNEYWYARDLQRLLEYTEYRKFLPVIAKAKKACKSSGHITSDHFADVGGMVEIGSGATRNVDDIKLTRYACYLIAMNGDPRKEVIALAQTYFAVKTHEQETIERYDKDIKRLEARDQLKESEKRLSQNIYERGVDNKGFARIRSKGDTALFGGHSTQAMKDKLGVSPTRPLADFLPTVTIAAKNLATEMTSLNSLNFVSQSLNSIIETMSAEQRASNDSTILPKYINFLQGINQQLLATIEAIVVEHQKTEAMSASAHNGIIQYTNRLK